MNDLFEPPAPVITAPVREPSYEQCARETFALPGNWLVFKWEAIGHDWKTNTPSSVVLVTGAVCPNVKTKGARKGDPDWKTRDKTTERTVPLVLKDYDTWLVKWEHEERKCYHCRGTGQEWAGWSATEGEKCRPCNRCGATGNPPTIADVPA